MADPVHPNKPARVPRAVWVLGFVSMLMDISSEMIHSLLPVFLVTVLGASALTVGVLEGAAEALAQMVKVFSGVVSDWLGKRKMLALLGYGLAAATKPAFPLAGGIGLIVAARLVDRIGKGIRGAPRDALIADLTTPDIRGAAFGLRQSLDTIGAVAGPLIAVGLMVAWAGDFRAVFWIAAVPAALSVLLLLLGVSEPDTAPSTEANSPIRLDSLRRLGRRYWWVVALGAAVTLARLSEAFLILRAQSAGIEAALVPLALVAMNVVYALSAYPFGRLSDRIGSRALLGAGLAVLIAAHLILAFSAHWSALLVGVLAWGLHMGMTQGVFAAMVAGAAPADLRGTAFGFFNLAGGLAMLVAGAASGLLWDWQGPATAFFGGAAMCLLALLMLLRPPLAPAPPPPV